MTAFPLVAKPTLAQRAYLAGFIDGEGCFTLSLSKQGVWSCRLAIFNSNLQLLEDLRAIFGGFIQVRQRSPKWKPAGQLTWTESTLLPILRQVLPFLRVKREQAAILLAVQTTKAKSNKSRFMKLSPEVLEFRQGAQLRLAELNARGVKEIAVC